MSYNPVSPYKTVAISLILNETVDDINTSVILDMRVIKYPSNRDVMDAVGQYIKSNINTFDPYFQELAKCTTLILDFGPINDLHTTLRTTETVLIRREYDCIFNIAILKEILINSKNHEVAQLLMNNYDIDDFTSYKGSITLINQIEIID